jgi:predicted dehydrogenase
MGRWHAATLAGGEVPGAVLTAVCDADPHRLHGHDHPHAELGELLADDTVDALVVATPHRHHLEAVEAACHHGVHVLVEKPLAVEVAAAVRMAAAVEDAGVVAAVDLPFRFRPVQQQAHRLVAAGALGPLRRVSCIATTMLRPQSYFSSSPWRGTWAGEGGGLLINQYAHQLDLLCWHAGQPEVVAALVRDGAHHDIEVEDEVTAILAWPNGASGSFVASTGEAPGTDRLELVGERGRIVVDGDVLRHDDLDPPVPEFIASSSDHYGSPMVTTVEECLPDRGSPHLALLTDFVRAVREARAPAVPLADGLWSLELATRIREVSGGG